MPTQELLATAGDVLKLAYSLISQPERWCQRGTKNAQGDTIPYHFPSAVQRSSSSAMMYARGEATPIAGEKASKLLVQAYGGNINDQELRHEQVLARWNRAFVAAGVTL